MIKLSLVVNAIEMEDVDTRTYIDLDNNEILMQNTFFEDEELEERLQTGNILPMPYYFKISNTELLREFIRKYIHNNQEYAYSLTYGKGAFRRFKEYLRYINKIEAYHKFIAENNIKIAKELLESNNIVYIDDLKNRG